MKRISFLDTHTAGEPTRIVLDGGPDLGSGPLHIRRERFRRQHDSWRSAIVQEPRGSEVLVGAVLVPPTDGSCVTGVIFFNNVGYLGMCGHGTMGVAVALGYLGRIQAGRYQLETPVGVVPFEYDGVDRVTLENVPSYRHAKQLPVDVAGYGQLRGDVAWGGNWFFLVNACPEPVSLSNVERLTELGWQIRQALPRAGITGEDGAEIDHIELFGPPTVLEAHSKNFVLCPGKAYDRSPCGTGTSAKLACLVADGRLAPGQLYRQESILGSLFEGSVRMEGEKIIPRISGSAYVTAEGSLLLDARDPFCMGIRP